MTIRIFPADVPRDGLTAAERADMVLCRQMATIHPSAYVALGLFERARRLRAIGAARFHSGKPAIGIAYVRQDS